MFYFLVKSTDNKPKKLANPRGEKVCLQEINPDQKYPHQVKTICIVLTVLWWNLRGLLNQVVAWKRCLTVQEGVKIELVAPILQIIIPDETKDKLHVVTKNCKAVPVYTVLPFFMPYNCRTRRCTLTARGAGLLPVAPFVFPVFVA